MCPEEFNGCFGENVKRNSKDEDLDADTKEVDFLMTTMITCHN